MPAWFYTLAEQRVTLQVGNRRRWTIMADRAGSAAEGMLGLFDSHTRIDCSDEGADRTEDVTPSPGSRYYLVVPRTTLGEEGSYGVRTGGMERLPANVRCSPVQVLGCP